MSENSSDSWHCRQVASGEKMFPASMFWGTRCRLSNRLNRLPSESARMKHISLPSRSGRCARMNSSILSWPMAKQMDSFSFWRKGT